MPEHRASSEVASDSEDGTQPDRPLSTWQVHLPSQAASTCAYGSHSQEVANLRALHPRLDRHHGQLLGSCSLDALLLAHVRRPQRWTGSRPPATGDVRAAWPDGSQCRRQNNGGLKGAVHATGLFDPWETRRYGHKAVGIGKCESSGLALCVPVTLHIWIRRIRASAHVYELAAESSFRGGGRAQRRSIVDNSLRTVFGNPLLL